MILLDTNVLLRIADASSAHHEDARKAVRILLRRPDPLVVVPQNLYEFWAAATRPTAATPMANGLGLSASRADFWLDHIRRSYRLAPDPPELSSRWQTLVRTSNVIGSKSHDARLVAAMQLHNINQLLTFNVGDFKRYHALTVIDPRSVS